MGGFLPRLGRGVSVGYVVGAPWVFGTARDKSFMFG